MDFSEVKSRYDYLGSWIYTRNPFHIDYSKYPYKRMRFSKRIKLTDIAHKFYGNACYWWVIAEANLILNPFDDVPVNRDIIIPDIKSIQEVI